MFKNWHISAIFSFVVLSGLQFPLSAMDVDGDLILFVDDAAIEAMRNRAMAAEVNEGIFFHGAEPEDDAPNIAKIQYWRNRLHCAERGNADLPNTKHRK